MTEERGKLSDADILEQSVDAFLASVGDSAVTVAIYRWSDDNSVPWEYVGKEPFDQFSEELLQRAYGGGRFDLRVWSSDKKKRGGFLGHRIVQVAGPRRDFSEPGDGRAAPVPAPAPTESGNELEKARARIRELEDMRFDQRIDAVRAELLGAIRDLRRVPVEAETAPVTDLTRDLIKTLLTERLQPHIETPVRGIGDQLPLLQAAAEILKVGVSIGQERGGSEGSSYPELILNRVLPLVDRMIPAGPPQPGTGAPAPNAAPAPASAEVTPNPPVPMNLRAALAPYMPTVIGWAKSGMDPNDAADEVLDNLPRRWESELAAFLNKEQGGAITVLVDWYPEAQSVRGWMAQFLEGLRYDLFHDEADEILDENSSS